MIIIVIGMLAMASTAFTLIAIIVETALVHTRRAIRTFRNRRK